MLLKILSISAALFLSACAATGPEYSHTPLQNQEASVVVYKTQTYGNAVSFTANGRKCRVQPQGYVDLVVPAGESLTLRHRSLGDLFPSSMTITPKAGERHYVRVDANVSAIASAIGGIVATAAATDQGTFKFVAGSAAEAQGTRHSSACE